MSEQHTLPQLKGTEKQIAWAEKIRTVKLAELETWLADEDAVKHAGMKRHREAILPRIRRRVQASWWIEQRDKAPNEVAFAVSLLLRQEERKAAEGSN